MSCEQCDDLVEETLIEVIYNIEAINMCLVSFSTGMQGSGLSTGFYEVMDDGHLVQELFAYLNQC